MHANGHAVFKRSMEKRPLRRYIRPEAQARVMQSGLSPTIHSFSDEIICRVANEIVDSRPTVYMHHAQDGRDLHTQLEREFQAKSCLDQSSDLRQTSSTRTKCDRPSSPQAGPNAERRKRFLQGGMVHCSRRKEDQYGRLTLRRSLCILVLRHADFDNVWFQCELLVGAKHPKTCAENAPQSDLCSLAAYVR